MKKSTEIFESLKKPEKKQQTKQLVKPIPVKLGKRLKGKIEKMLPGEKRMIELRCADPKMKIAEMGRQLVEEGYTKSPGYAHQRLRENENLSIVMARAMEKHDLQIEMKTPKALQVLDQHLDKGSLRAAEVQLRARRGFDESKRPVAPTTIQIDEIKAFMVTIQDDLLKKYHKEKDDVKEDD